MPKGGLYSIGQQFGPYTLEAFLGAGAFKSVYRARNRGSGAPVEVVALGFPHQQDPESLAELEKEFSVMQRLVHPNITRVFAVEHYGGVTFLVMEYLEGVSLHAKLRESGGFEVSQAVRHAGLICEALAYAHAAHVLHRDVKPQNMFVTTDGVLKLLDFGVARALARTSDKASTRVGTIEYMAPELFHGAAGTNADLWALGITLYEMLTGQRPFAGEVAELIQQILNNPYDEAPLREKEVDNRLVRVLRKLLRKNPEERYQSADDVARDLEAVARRSRIIDDDEGRLEMLIRASYPLIGVFTFEEERVLEAVQGIAGRLSEDRRSPRRVYFWRASRGLQDESGKVVRSNTVKDPTVALLHLIENPEDAIYVFLDIHAHFTPVTTRLIRDAARAVRQTRKSILFMSPTFQAPEELEKEMYLMVFGLPDRAHLEALVDAVAEECRTRDLPAAPPGAERTALARAALGLTLRETERALRNAVEHCGGLIKGADRVIIQEKTQVIRKTGILEYYHTPETFADVGGLENLMAWFQARTPVFAGTARYAGLPAPKGVLLVGVPGCGKSLSARALAGAWGVPLLRLDVGRVFASLVGSSEANLRRALQTAEAVSPCVLWIDEVEKGFSGIQGQSGGGVAARVFGTFLSWLQDKRSPVFVVATSNDLSGLPPEFLRPGRFDEKFFVGLPNGAQREQILRIHLEKRRRKPDGFDVPTLSEKSEGFSGAELEQAVIEGMFRAFDQDRELQTDDIAGAMADTYPLSRSRAREIAMLTHWAQANARQANREDGRRIP